ncbi:hypothetical protein AB0J82_31225 [Asanoa sp. NPDC049518]|uniref:hypothetical protein n=1 Tax=unclassified Asanoa TaxID=2685164 RepID=UPI00341D304B
MSEHTSDEVAESIGGAYWSVDEGRWETVAPALPDHVVDLLAPPILVGAAPCGTDAVAALPMPDPTGPPTALDRLDMLVPAAREPRAVAIA